MLGSLLRARRQPIGLDIGTDSIKMLQLQPCGTSLSVSASGQHWLGRQAAEPGPARRKATAEIIHKMLRTGGFAGRRVVSSLSSSMLDMRNLRVAPMPESELAEAIRWEAGERFAFDVGPDTLKWINAGQVRQGDEMRDEIIMLATPAEAINEHLALLDEAGLVPEYIEAEPVALFRVFQQFLRRREDESSVSVIVDIGRSATRIMVARGSRIIFIKRIDIGGAKFTEAVAKQLNLTYDEAHELRVRIMKEHAGRAVAASRDGDSGSAPPPDGEASKSLSSVDWTIQDAMRGEVEELGKEIALCLRYCSVTFRGLRPDCVVLTGGEAYDGALVGLLGENLSLSCVVGRPLRGIDVSRMEVAADRRGTLAEWAVCAGLAMKEICDEGSFGESGNAEHRLSA